MPSVSISSSGEDHGCLTGWLSVWSELINKHGVVPGSLTPQVVRSEDRPLLSRGGPHLNCWLG